MGVLGHLLLRTSARIPSFITMSPEFKAELDSDTRDVRGYTVPWLA